MADNRWFANRGQIIQIAFSALACLLAAVKAWPDMRTNELLSAGALLFYILAALVVYSGVRLVNGLLSTPERAGKPDVDPYADSRTLAMRLILEDFSYLLEHYRRLDYDYRDSVRLPLSNASWPAFGREWTFVDATLYMLNMATEMTTRKAREVWKEMGWAEYESRIFNANQQTLMIDVLEGLREGIEFLRRQIEKPAI